MHIEASPASAHRQALIAATILTSVYLVAEAVGGVWTHSLALLADAGHMLTDVGGLVLSLVAIHFAARPATEQRTFGLYRAEVLAALTNALVLVLVSVGILWEAYARWREPPMVAAGPMLAVASVGLVVNVGSFALLRRGAGHSINVKGAYLEVLSDLLASIGVIVAALTMRSTGWYWVDPAISAMIGMFILPRTFRLMWDAVSILLESTPAGVSLARVRQELRSVRGVLDVHDLHVWAITSGMYSLTAHLSVAPNHEPSAVLAEAARRIETRFSIAHTTLQLEPADFNCERLHE
jgi:cobalt-zinc-cadmium efflux system protein